MNLRPGSFWTRRSPIPIKAVMIRSLFGASGRWRSISPYSLSPCWRKTVGRRPIPTPRFRIVSTRYAA